jgi:hypothetical protein
VIASALLGALQLGERMEHVVIGVLQVGDQQPLVLVAAGVADRQRGLLAERPQYLALGLGKAARRPAIDAEHADERPFDRQAADDQVGEPGQARGIRGDRLIAGVVRQLQNAPAAPAVDHLVGLAAVDAQPLDVDIGQATVRAHAHIIAGRVGHEDGRRVGTERASGALGHRPQHGVKVEVAAQP